VSNSWSEEFWRAVGFLIVALAAGLLLGHSALFLFLATLAYLAWHLRSLYLLERWLGRGARGDPPAGSGIWEEVYNGLYRLQQRHRKRKLKLADFLGRFRASTAAMPDATVVLRPSGEIEWFNEAAARLFGLRSPQDLGQRIDNLVRHPRFAAFLARGQYTEALELASPVDEQIMLAVNVVPYGGDQRLLVARDVTRIHRLEEMRRDFVANVSHELRTPLTVVGGFLETMADDGDEYTKKWGRSLELMREHTARMQRIVDDLLLLSRLETEKRGERVSELVSVPALVAAIQEEAVALSGAQQHYIHADIDRKLWLRGKETELRSAFSNLVSNAVRYTPKKGRIDIRWYADAAGAHFEVQDTGVGIEARHIPRLTERFYRADVARSRASGGTGLGLAIVKHVLERHGASLHITSAIGKGSTFCCDFPAHLIERR